MKFKKLDDIDTNNYTHVNDQLPIEDGLYDVIFHCGSMSISYKIMRVKFKVNKGVFARSDWDYVIMWKGGIHGD